MLNILSFRFVVLVSHVERKNMRISFEIALNDRRKFKLRRCNMEVYLYAKLIWRVPCSFGERKHNQKRVGSPHDRYRTHFSATRVKFLSKQKKSNHFKT